MATPLPWHILTTQTCIYSVDPIRETEPYVINTGISAYGTDPKSVSSLSFSPSGQLIAVGTCQLYEREELHGQQSIIVINLKSGEKQVITCDSVVAVAFVSDDSLASIQYISIEDHFNFTYLNRNYSAFLYDLEGNVRWHISDMQMSGLWNTSSCKILPLLDFNVKGNQADLVAFNIVNSLIVMDTVRNETVLHHIFDGHIVGIDRRKDNIFVGLDDGSVYRHWITSYTRLYSIHSEVHETLFNDNALSMISVNYDSQRIVFAGIVEDTRMVPSTVRAADLPCANVIHEVDGLSATYNAQSSVIRIVGKEPSDVWEIPLSNDRTPLYSFFRSGTQLLVYNNEQWIEIWDIRSHSIISEQPLNQDGSWNSKIKTELIIDPAGEYFALSYGEGNMYVDSKNGWNFPELVIYYIDSDCTIYPYSIIPYGAVDFEKHIVYSVIQAIDTCYEAPFYTYSELIDAAKAIIDERDGI